MALNIRIDEDFTFNVYEDINEDNFFNTNSVTETGPDVTFDEVRFHSGVLDFAAKHDIKTEPYPNYSSVGENGNIDCEYKWDSKNYFSNDNYIKEIDKFEVEEDYLPNINIKTETDSQLFLLSESTLQETLLPKTEIKDEFNADFSTNFYHNCTSTNLHTDSEELVVTSLIERNLNQNIIKNKERDEDDQSDPVLKNKLLDWHLARKKQDEAKIQSRNKTSLLQDEKTIRAAPAIQEITTSPTVKSVDFVLLERTLTDLQLKTLRKRSVENSGLVPDTKRKRVTSDNVAQESYNQNKTLIRPFSFKSRDSKKANQAKNRTFFDLKGDLSKSNVAAENVQRGRIGLRIMNLRKGTPSVSLLFSSEECSSLQSSCSSQIKSSESYDFEVSSVSSASKSENNTPPSVVSRRKCDGFSKRKLSDADRSLTCSRAAKDKNWLSESEGKSSSISETASSLQISSMKTKISRQMDTTSGIQSGSTTPASAASSVWNIHRIVKKSEAENNRKRQMNEEKLNQLLRDLYKPNSVKLSTRNNPEIEESANLICESDQQNSKSIYEGPGRNQKRPAEGKLNEKVKQLNVEENGKVLFCKPNKVLHMKVVSYQGGSNLKFSSGAVCSEGVDLKRLPFSSNTGRTSTWVNRHFWESSGVGGDKEKAPDDSDERLTNRKNSKDVGDAARKECRGDALKFVGKSDGKGVGKIEDSLDEMLTNNDRSRGMLNECSNKTEQNENGSKVGQNEVFEKCDEIGVNGNKNQVKIDTAEMSERCQNQNITFEKETRSRSNAKRLEVIEEIRNILSRNIDGCGKDKSVVAEASSEKNREVASLPNEKILSETTVGPTKKSCKFGEEEIHEVSGEGLHFLNGNKRKSATGVQDASVVTLEASGTKQNGDLRHNKHFLGVAKRIPEKNCKKESIRMTLENQNGGRNAVFSRENVRNCDSGVERNVGENVGAMQFESSFKAKKSQAANKLPVRLKLPKIVPKMGDFLVVGDFTNFEKTNSTCESLSGKKDVALAKTNSNAKVVTKKDENGSQKKIEEGKDRKSIGDNKNSFSAGRIESLRGNWNRKCDFKVESNAFLGGRNASMRNERKPETQQSESVSMDVSGKLRCSDSPQTEILVRESSCKNDDDNLDVNTFSRKTPEKTVDRNDRNLGATTRMSKSSEFCNASSLVKSKMGKCLQLDENRRDGEMVVTDAACDSSKVGSRSFDHVLAKQCGNVSDKKFSRVYKRLFGIERDCKRHTRSTKSWMDEKENRRKKFNCNGQNNAVKLIYTKTCLRNQSVGETSKDKKRNSKAPDNTRSKRLGRKEQYKVNPSTPAKTEKCFKESSNVVGCKQIPVEFRDVIQDKTPQLSDDKQKESKKETGDEFFNYSHKRMDRVRKRERSLKSKKEFVGSGNKRERNVDNAKKPQTRSATAERSKETVDQTRNAMMLRKRKSVAPVPVLH